MNIPYSQFYENETSATIDYDAVTSATTKSKNGGLTYGTYHKATEEAKDSKILGIT